MKLHAGVRFEREVKMDNNHSKELDYGISMATQTLVKAIGMFSENMLRKQKGEEIPFGIKSFSALIDENGTHHNSVLSRYKDI